ncbi:methionyl-tRNA formyltransferase [Corynebacterium sp. P7003]|uniref:Methionyl-tRNA formyltransferase n=1 Tax=Corynebacterium pygosceleis TaxID=2800406 RepID=A0ABT3WS44_9CORY|nr:methionyl-tRNA formyltransferase [Corynebacterium pygosceleis]MCX7443794.1 methionyl-tRNA formyltransferase [Corynebacterium pygosceleis]
MRLVFAGTPEPAVVALEKLLASDHEVLAVITRPDARRGRGRTLHPSPVAETATAHGVEVLKPTSLKPDTAEGRELRARLAELSPDCIPVVAYGNLVTADLLGAAPHGWVNLHFSLLPAWRGAAPVQAAIAAGDRETGAATFRIEEGLDTGPVFRTVTEPISPGDTADDLLTKLAHSGARLLVDTMDGIADGSLHPTPQSGEPSHAPKISKEDARIDWTATSAVIDRRIRAHTPAPGAWTTLDGERMKIGPVLPTGDGASVSGVPGALRVTGDGVVVGTGDGAVVLRQVQAPGKKMMAAMDWARGAHPGEGTVLV